MSARIFSVGRPIPGNAAEFVPFRSDKSLFDGDVILFHPTFEEYDSLETYAGHPLITEADSPDLVRDCAHWSTELREAVEAGKVVFVFLAKPVDVYYDTGARTYSGTGRSRVTTRQVSPKNSYDSIPVRLVGLMPRGGAEVAVMQDLGPLAAYWSQFGPRSAYEVYFEPAGIRPLLGTKKREKVVGALVPTKKGGALVLLPPVQWDEDALSYSRGKGSYWRKEGVALGSALIAALVAASDALRREGKRSAVPEWAVATDYALKREDRVRSDIARLDDKARELAEKRKSLERQLSDAVELRGLLYESGKPLEAAILKALVHLGFTAEPYRDAESEFDAVFSSAEGRFLGEAEGRDTKAINIDKMTQLERNLQEDFAREAVTEYAKGVLFGNASRFDPPPKRGPFFTEKCVSAAKRLRVALVRTPDLFLAARYLSEHDDASYARACREVLFRTEGDIVVFPDPPSFDEGGA
jgi:hypothetical protein